MRQPAAPIPLVWQGFADMELGLKGFVADSGGHNYSGREWLGRVPGFGEVALKSDRNWGAHGIGGPPTF